MDKKDNGHRLGACWLLQINRHRILRTKKKGAVAYNKRIQPNAVEPYR
jgi:hypothetical protein